MNHGTFTVQRHEPWYMEILQCFCNAMLLYFYAASDAVTVQQLLK